MQKLKEMKIGHEKYRLANVNVYAVYNRHRIQVLALVFECSSDKRGRNSSNVKIIILVV